MQGEDFGEILPEVAELGHRDEATKGISIKEGVASLREEHEIRQRQDDEGRNLEDAEELDSADANDQQDRQQNPAHQTTHLLVELDLVTHLFDLFDEGTLFAEILFDLAQDCFAGRIFRRQFVELRIQAIGLLAQGGEGFGLFLQLRKPRGDPGHGDLEGSKGNAIGTGGKNGGDDRDAPQLGGEEHGKTGALELAGGPFLQPHFGFRNERQHQCNGDGRENTRHQQVAPGAGGCGSECGRQPHQGHVGGVRADPETDRGDEDTSQRGTGLGDAEPLFPLMFVLEDLRKPGDGGHKFHADPNEGRGTEKDEHAQRSAVGGRERRERVDENA